jgi:primosomal protein N' (replication factor Y)
VAEPAVPDTRPILALVDPAPVSTPPQLALAEKLAQDTLAPLVACISLMVPPGLSQQVDTLYTLAEDWQSQGPSAQLTPLQTRFVKLLERRGPLRSRQIDRALPRVNWRQSVQLLVQRRQVMRSSVLPPPTVRPKYIRTAQLALPPETIETRLDTLGKPGSQAFHRRQAIMQFLLTEPDAVDVAWVYAESGGKSADLRWLADRGLVRLGESHVWRDPLEGLDFVPDQPLVLTPDQEAAWESIGQALAASHAGKFTRPILLCGVTGSGKTELYLRAVADTLTAGRQAIILVPEIALTAQTVRRFVARFPGRVGLIHSRLSPGERYDTWRRARAGELDIVIGPRSALFAPLPNLGLIAVDESHDDSYYQAGSPPHYHAREVACEYARLAKAVCLMGTATPDVVSLYRAQKDEWTLVQLPARILAHREAVYQKKGLLGGKSRFKPWYAEAETIELPPVQIVDMRTELREGNRSIFSISLQEAIAQTLQRGEQGILFLNRRGAATYVFCRDCGHGLRCPQCDTALTLHRSPERLTCHHCGYLRQVPKKCPVCGSARIRGYGTGTETVVEELERQFPKARTLRWDRDTTRQKGAHDIILSHFANHRADFLIGTQMLAKGLDLPLVTLVGVVLADVGLHLPDYRAGERTFQVLTQVAGRAGRSPLGGQVVLQTFQPEHYVIQAAAKHDYDGFYQQELGYRQELELPPYTRLVRLEYRHRDRQQAQTTAQNLAARLRQWLLEESRRSTDLIGPAPCFYARREGYFRWQIILRGPNPASLLTGRIPKDWHIEVNPPALL